MTSSWPRAPIGSTTNPPPLRPGRRRPELNSTDFAEEQGTDPEERHLRRCLVSGDRRSRDEMLRFVLSPDGEVTVDVAARLPGRGFWLSPGRDVINTAARKGLFSKAAKARVRVPGDLADRAEALLVKRIQHWLGMARRAGEAVAGYEKAKTWLIQGRALLYLQASDAGADGKDRLTGLLRDPDLGLERVPALLSAAELGEAMGRERAVHLAIAPGGVAGRLLLEFARLGGFRDEDGD